jgi:transposase
MGLTRMPDFDVALNLPGFTIAGTSGFKPIVHDLDCHHEPHCPHFGGCNLRKKDKVHRNVWHESVGLRRVLLRFSQFRKLPPSGTRAMCLSRDEIGGKLLAR